MSIAFNQPSIRTEDFSGTSGESAGTNIAQYQVVYFDGTNYKITDASTRFPIAIAKADTDDVDGGGRLNLIMTNKAGTYKFIAGGTVTADELVAPADNGRVVTHTNPNWYILGKALTTASAGEYVEVAVYVQVPVAHGTTGIKLDDDENLDLGTGDDFSLFFDATALKLRGKDASNSFDIGVASRSVDVDIIAGDLTLTDGDLTITSGDIVHTAGDHTMTAGNLTLTLGNFTLTNGNIVHTAGDYTMSSGTMSISGALTVATGDVTITDGNIVHTEGNFTMSDGNLTVAAGNVGVTLGNITIGTGSFTISSGSATLTAGDMTLTDGNVVLTDGEVIFNGGTADQAIFVASGASVDNFIHFETDATGGVVASVTAMSALATTEKIKVKVGGNIRWIPLIA